jgi:hypothetical protein
MKITTAKEMRNIDRANDGTFRRALAHADRHRSK